MGLGAHLPASLFESGEEVGVVRPTAQPHWTWAGSRAGRPKLVSQRGVSIPSIRPVAGLLQIVHSALSPSIHLGIVNILHCRAKGSMPHL